nr:AMP-binding protein [Breznakibacter sp.]
MKSLIQFFEDSVKQYGDRPFLWDKREAVYQSTSYKETFDKVEVLANGFLANDLQYGQRVALLSEGRPYWLISELAVLYCGAINV